MVEVEDRAERGSAELRQFDDVATSLSSGWRHYERTRGFAGGSATAGGPVPTVRREGAHAPVMAAEWLEALDETFVPPDEFAMAKRMLESRHVVVLQGLSRCGKTSLGVKLLRGLGARQPYCVYATSDLPSVLDEQAGYLVDDLSAADAAKLDVPRVRELEERARAAKSYVVVTVDDEVAITRPAAALLVPCGGTPDAAKVLHRGLARHFGEPLPGEVARFVDDAYIKNFLRSQPLPGVVAQLVEALIRANGDAGAARRRFDQALAQEVTEWFKRYPTVKDRSFMIAAAVFQGSSLDRVDQAARLLAESFGGRSAGGERGTSSWRLLSPRERRLRAIGANLIEEQEWTPAGVTPTRVVRFEPTWLPGTVLRHVWEQHDDARQPLVTWLKQWAVSDGEDEAINLHAAAALGVLGREDIGWLSHAIQQWVLARTGSTRDAAAIALATYARERRYSDQLMPLLHRRVRDDPSSRRSAMAAVVYGLLAEERFVDQGLDDLRAILSSGSRRIPVVARSLAMLCESEHAGAALETLCQWAQQPRVPGALEVLARLLDWDAPAQGEMHDEPPLLLWIARDDASNRASVVELWSHAWEGGVRRDWLQRAMAKWLRYVQDHHTGRVILDALVEELNRKGARMRLLMWMDEWAESHGGPRTIATEYRKRLIGANPLALPAARALRTSRRAADSSRRRLLETGR